MKHLSNFPPLNQRSQLWVKRFARSPAHFPFLLLLTVIYIISVISACLLLADWQHAENLCQVPKGMRRSSTHTHFRRDTADLTRLDSTWLGAGRIRLKLELRVVAWPGNYAYLSSFVYNSFSFASLKGSLQLNYLCKLRGGGGGDGSGNITSSCCQVAFLLCNAAYT